MKALVTGGSGFIGSDVIRMLNAQGIEVRALLRKSSSLDNLTAGLKKAEFETVYGDVTDYDSLKAAVEGVDLVFHLAGVITAKDREDYFRANAAGTGNLARACAEFNPNLKRFVYVSSIAASGPAGSLKARTESETEQPVSNYGASKLGGERELKRWAKSFPYSIVRPPIVYGPRDRGIFEFVKVLNAGFLPVLKGNTETGEKYYSVVHVSDLVDGILRSGLAEGLGREEIFFICGDGEFTWSNLMGCIADNLAKKPIRVPIPGAVWTGIAAMSTGYSFFTKRQSPLTLDKLNELRADYWICSNERAKLRLGYQPKVTLEHGMQETVSWYRENGWIC